MNDLISTRMHWETNKLLVLTHRDSGHVCENISQLNSIKMSIKYNVQRELQIVLNSLENLD